MKLVQRIVLGYYRNKFKALEKIAPSKAVEAAFQLFCTPYSRRRKLVAPPLFEQAKKHAFSFQHNTIRGFEWQPSKKNGYKVLICHGFDSCSFRFEQYIQPLLNQGFEVFAFDAPAHGVSTGKTITALSYSDMILEVNRKYGPFDGIMAHSFGGIAVALATEKLQDDHLKRLVLIAPATETTRSLNDFCRVLKISKKLKESMENRIINIAGQPASWYSIARIIKTITVPTLWLHDVNDTITPYDDMKHLREIDLPNVEFVITEGLGHSLYRTDEMATRIIQFLSAMNSKQA